MCIYMLLFFYFLFFIFVLESIVCSFYFIIFDWESKILAVSFYVLVNKELMFLVNCRIGIGRISACGGGGFAGGGGGRVAVDIYSRHDEPVIAAHGRTWDIYFTFCIFRL